MLNEAIYEQDWVAQPAPTRPYMESNRWLANACTTRSPKVAHVAETETFEILGLKLVWIKDRGRGFPTPVLEALQKLFEFSELKPGWDSYGGVGLQKAAGQTVLQMIVRAHQFARLPRMHPLGDGGIGLNWEGNPELEILVAGDGTVEGLLTAGDDATELPFGSPAAAGIDLVERYLANR